MKYKIYTRPNPHGGQYVIVEVDGEKKYEKYCGTDIGAKWHAYWLNEKVKAGKAVLPGDSLYEGTIK